MRKKLEVVKAYKNAQECTDSDYRCGYLDALKFVLELNRTDNYNPEICIRTNLCKPNQCRVDNGYSKSCITCKCRNCIRSDCHPETMGYL